jgi:hypothetical protein
LIAWRVFGGRPDVIAVPPRSRPTHSHDIDRPMCAQAMSKLYGFLPCRSTRSALTAMPIDVIRSID